MGRQSCTQGASIYHLQDGSRDRTGKGATVMKWEVSILLHSHCRTLTQVDLASRREANTRSMIERLPESCPGQGALVTVSQGQGEWSNCSQWSLKWENIGYNVGYWEGSLQTIKELMEAKLFTLLAYLPFWAAENVGYKRYAKHSWSPAGSNLPISCHSPCFQLEGRQDNRSTQCKWLPASLLRGPWNRL